ncbi:MAG: hypothetical protein QM791_19135 [Ferruginibacter sp.]
MKKIINSLFKIISTASKEKNAANKALLLTTGTSTFTSADLWNIHRNGRIRPQRRFL